MSQLNCSFRFGVVWIVMRSVRAPSFPWPVNVASPHLVSCQKQCTCWSISAFPRCLEPFLFASSIHSFIHYSYVFFSSVGQVLSSPTDGVLLESLLDCEVLVTNHHCFRSAYGNWDFIVMGQWRPTSYRFGSVHHRSPDRFLHKPVFGIEDCASRFLLYCFSLVPLWTHQVVYKSDSGDCHFKEFRAASFEIYSLPMQLRIQFWTLVRAWINTCWIVKDSLVVDVLMYV